MDDLLTRLSATLTPQVLGELERSAGVDHTRLQAGVEATGPLIQHGLAEASRSPEGLRQIIELLPPAVQPDPIGPVLHVYVYGSHEQNAVVERMENLALGEGRAAAERALSAGLGFAVAPLTPLITPLLFALLKNLVVERGLLDVLTADLLQQGDAEFLASGKAEVELVRAAAEAGRAGATLKQRFTPAEWAQIGRAPLAVAALIMAAAPQGVRGTYKEEAAAVRAVEAAHQSAPPVSLMTLVYPDHVPLGELEQMARHPDKPAMLAAVKAAVEAIAAKDAAEADGFRAFLLLVAQRVAEAAREHTVLGLGGTAVSPEEQAALNELRGLLA